MMTLIAGLSLALAGPLAAQQSPPAAQSPPVPVVQTQTKLDVRTSPIIDLHFFARRVAAGDAIAPALDGFNRVVETQQALAEMLGGPRAWLMFDHNFLDCDTAAQLLDEFSRIPESTMMRGRTVNLREAAVAYGESLAAIEPAWLRDHWPARKQSIRTAHEGFAPLLEQHESACLAFMIRSLAIDDPRATIPVYLVADAPFPGASTSATMDDRPVCFVAIDELQGTLMLETILHEATHGLDILTRGEPTALNRLRVQLAEAGVTQLDPRFRDAWHTIMFINTGEAVRRVVDPAHVHYGDAEKYYDKVPDVTRIERPVWIDHLDGKLTLDETIAKLTAELGAWIKSNPPDAPPR
jgi:hypothetical protein